MAVTQKQLAHALALARHGNFTQAAEESNLSQPAFSRSIKNLEQALGVLLFDRGAPTVMPTRYGEVFLQRAQSIVTDTQELLRDIGLMHGLASGHLCVALGMFPAEVSGNRALGKMVSEYPGLTYRSQVGNWALVSQQILSRVADLGFALTNGAYADERLAVDPVSRHELVLFCRKDHPLAGCRHLEQADLDQFPLVTIRAPAEYADMIPGRSRVDSGSGLIVPSVEIDNFATVRAAVRASNSISAAVPLQIESELDAGEFVLLKHQRPWLRPEHGFILLKGRSISPAAEKYMEYVRECEKEAEAANFRVMEKYLLQV
jgi:DNA-binding transcriptional LysR family regulator